MNAFDGGAFDSVAFDVGDVTPAVDTFNRGYIAPPRKKVDDSDDELLLAWFMFMRQPHENQ